MSKPTVFITGATGYIGGSILWRFVSSSSKTYAVRALVRNAEKAATLKSKFGSSVEVVVGSLTDEALLEKEAQAADVVIHTADADGLKAAQAILRGLKNRFEKSGTKGVLIHTSGTIVISDSAVGEYASDKIYDDANAEDIHARLQRDVDIAVVQADTDGYALTYVIAPCTTYGYPKNGLVDAGLQNIHSVQLPILIRQGLKRGQGGIIGKGQNKWPNVHIDDLTDFYMLLFNKIRSNSSTVPHGREGYFFAASDEHTVGVIQKAVAENLYALGKAKSPEPTLFSKEEAGAFWGELIFGSNARCKSSKAYALGWAPTHGTKDLLAFVKPEVESIVKGA